jgi:hypothetical protein
MATRKTSTKSTTTKTAKPKAQRVIIPPWPGIADDALEPLATKIDKAKDSYRISDMIRKVNGDDWRSRIPIAWHLAACRAIHPETNSSVLDFLADAPEVPAPEVAMDVLVRLPDGSSTRYFSNTSLLMDGYSLPIDKLLFATYRRAPEAVLSRESELNDSIRLGLSFVRRLLGETISPEASAAIMQQLAKHQAQSYGIALNNDLYVKENGEIVKFALADLPAVRKLALFFGTAKEWDDVLLAAALEGKWNQSRNVRDALVAASVSQLAQLVNRSNLDTGETLRTLLEIIPVREDAPDALFNAALTVENTGMREMLLMGVIYRAGKTGAPLPEKIDEHLTFEHLDTTYEGVRPACGAWFKSFPRERALAAARKLVLDEFRTSRAVGILAAHFDEGILREALEKDLGKNYIGAETLGGLGTVALPQLVASHDQTQGDGLRRMHRAILHAMARAPENTLLDEQWDRFVDFDQEGGKPVPYYSSSDAKLRETALRGVPEPRRSVLLLKRLEETQHPERILQVAQVAADASIIDIAIQKIVERKKLESGFREIADRLGEPLVEALCKHIGLSQGDGRFMEALNNQLSHLMFQRVEAALEKAGVRKETPRDALIRMAATAPGLKMRVYVLQVDREEYQAKPGTLARSGGKAPGMTDADIPKDKSGEPLTHLFTLDLDEIPELQETYPGARALAAFCPEPNSGDRSEELMLVPITREAAAALPYQARDAEGDEDDDDNDEVDEDAGRPIAILPLDVPIGVFHRSGDEGDLKEIKKMIFNAAGHVLGEPFWIQSDDEDDGGGGDFIMQINEGLCSINLGDSGSLYVFESGTVFQCY